MTMRLLMMICLMITMLMPSAWAGEKVTPPFEVPQEFEAAWNHVQQGTDSRSLHVPPDRDAFFPSHTEPVTTYLKAMSPLTKLHIESEDWTEDNTYYVRHTITNPTDELIEGDLDHLTITYVLYLSQGKPVYRTQYSDIIPAISLAPHSSQSFVTTLTINEPFDYIHFSHSIFTFTDGAELTYELSHGDTPPDILITPIILPSGDIYLAMKNHHFFKTVTDIRNIKLEVTEGFWSPAMFRFHYNTPLPLQLKPQETAFFRLPQSFPHQIKDVEFCHTTLTALIDHVSYYFLAHSSYAYKQIPPGYVADSYTKPSTRYYTPTVYEKHGMNFFNASGTFEMDDTTLYGYLRIKNPYNKKMLLSPLSGLFSFSYCSPDNRQEGFSFNAEYPFSLIIEPKGEAYLTFSVPLPAPQDVAKHPRLVSYYMYNGNLVSFNGVVFMPQKLSPLEKARYEYPMIIIYSTR